jgi:hypothetical protein
LIIRFFLVRLRHFSIPFQQPFDRALAKNAINTANTENVSERFQKVWNRRWRVSSKWDLKPLTLKRHLAFTVLIFNALLNISWTRTLEKWIFPNLLAEIASMRRNFGKILKNRPLNSDAEEEVIRRDVRPLKLGAEDRRRLSAKIEIWRREREGINHELENIQQ